MIVPSSPLRLAILSPLGRHGGALHGGITPVVRHLARRALERGVAVDLLLCSADTAEAPGGARVISLGRGGKAAQLARLRAYLREAAPQALLSAGMRANLLAALAARLGSRARIVASLHTTLSRNLAGQGIKRVLWRRLLRWPTHLVAVSAGVAEDLEANFGVPERRRTVLANPVVDACFDERARAAPAHPWLHEARPVLLAVGNLRPEKDYATLLRAFARLHAGHAARLLILGEGSERPRLEALTRELGIADDVAMPGFDPNPIAAMARARLLASSSRWEGLPTVLIEALAAGCPVVATDCPSGPREILDHGRVGPLVPVGDVEALAGALAATLESPPEHSRLRAAAGRFEADIACDRYLELLLDLPPTPALRCESPMSAPRFTVFIPTYNRAHLLPRALASVERQTLKDFEVVVVDDGSTDGTVELIEAWRARQSFPVTYHFQPNQGRHIAYNTGVQLARGQLFVNLDSDDQLLPEALERLLHHWEAIPVAARASFAGVEGLIAINGSVREEQRFPADVLDSNYVDIRIRRKIGGDKKNAVLTEVLRRYPYPVFPGERHIRPSLIWKRIAHRYRFRYVNDVLQDCEYQADGLSADRFALRLRNPRGFRLYHLEDITLNRPWYDLRQRMRSTLEYIRFSWHAGAGVCRQARDLGLRPGALLMWLALLPAGTLRSLRDRARLRRLRAHAAAR